MPHINTIKVKSVSPHFYLGRPDLNVPFHLEAMDMAESEGVRILALPSLSLLGNSLGSLFRSPDLLDQSIKALDRLIRASKKHPLLYTTVGLPLMVDQAVFSCQLLISNGEILGAVANEALLPGKGQVYLNQALSPWPLNKNREIRLLGQSFTIGRQIFRLDTPDGLRLDLALAFGSEIRHSLSLPNFLAKERPDLLLVGDALPKTLGSSQAMTDRLISLSRDLALGMVYTNTSLEESSSDFIYSPDQLILDHGHVLASLDGLAGRSVLRALSKETPPPALTSNYFVEGKPDRPLASETRDCRVSFMTRKKPHISALPFVPEKAEDRAVWAEESFNIQAHGLARRLWQIGAKSIVLGLSGGLDSTLALMAALRACQLLDRPASDILAVTMPGFGTSKETSGNAHILLEESQVSHLNISVVPASLQHFQDIGHDPAIHDATYENTQARERTQILMDLANKTGGLVIGTGDLSELALGWCTYNGDQMSMYSLNHSIPKTCIRPLLAHEAELLRKEGKERFARVLEDISQTPVSPELLPPDAKGQISQKTEDILGPYQVHDFFIYRLLVEGRSIKEAYDLALEVLAGPAPLYSEATIRQTLKILLRRFLSQQFKRTASPDGISVSLFHIGPRDGMALPADFATKDLDAYVDHLLD
jgi:NAD+ synthase (glutamine-hydrolysing)